MTATTQLQTTASQCVAAIARWTRTIARVLHAALTVTRRHVPKWIGVLITVCLFIPGPLDELLVLIVIAVMIAFKPAMRADLVAAVREARQR